MKQLPPPGAADAAGGNALIKGYTFLRLMCGGAWSYRHNQVARRTSQLGLILFHTLFYALCVAAPLFGSRRWDLAGSYQMEHFFPGLYSSRVAFAGGGDPDFQAIHRKTSRQDQCSQPKAERPCGERAALEGIEPQCSAKGNNYTCMVHPGAGFVKYIIRSFLKKRFTRT